MAMFVNMVTYAFTIANIVVYNIRRDAMRGM